MATSLIVSLGIWLGLSALLYRVSSFRPWLREIWAILLPVLMVLGIVLGIGFWSWLWPETTEGLLQGSSVPGKRGAGPAFLLVLPGIALVCGPFYLLLRWQNQRLAALPGATTNGAMRTSIGWICLRVAVVLPFALALALSPFIWSSYRARLCPNDGMSDWIELSLTQSFLDQQNWKRCWVQQVEGRWNDNRQEYRFDLQAVPNRPYSWHWWYGQGSESFQELDAKYRKEGYALRFTQSFQLPNGELLHQGIWTRYR